MSKKKIDIINTGTGMGDPNSPLMNFVKMENEKIEEENKKTEPLKKIIVEKEEEDEEEETMFDEDPNKVNGVPFEEVKLNLNEQEEFKRRMQADREKEREELLSYLTEEDLNILADKISSRIKFDRPRKNAVEVTTEEYREFHRLRDHFNEQTEHYAKRLSEFDESLIDSHRTYRDTMYKYMKKSNKVTWLAYAMGFFTGAMVTLTVTGVMGKFGTTGGVQKFKF